MAASRLEELERDIGYQFKDPDLIARALTHSSASGSATDRGPVLANEQLEYLGDAVLGMVVSAYLFHAFPHWSEGQLSKSRAKLVNSASLCSAARRLNLSAHLRLGRGEEKTGGREKSGLLADAYEAIVAAMYLDGGFSAARDFIARTLLDPLASEADRLEQSDHKSALQEFLQARGLPAARYNVVKETGPDHRKTFCVEVTVSGEVTASGTGLNKKEAEQSAAAQALERLREDG